MKFTCSHCGARLSKQAVEVVELNASIARLPKEQRRPPSKILTDKYGVCDRCGKPVKFEDLEKQRQGGFLSRLTQRVLAGDLMETTSVIAFSVYSYRSHHPTLTFREALERSLLETRPGWDQARIAMVRNALDEATTEEEMVGVVVRYEVESRRNKWGV